MVGERSLERGLRAVLSLDMVGYSRAMEADEAGTHRVLTQMLRHTIEPAIRRNNGEVIKTTGDGVLAEFESAVNAVKFAAEIQRELKAKNDENPLEKRLEFRIGIDVGDIIFEGNDAFGDGVILATRLESLAEPGSTYVSRSVFEYARGKVDVGFVHVGRRRVKNVSRTIDVYKIREAPRNALQRTAERTVAFARQYAYLLIVGLAVLLAGAAYLYSDRLPWSFSNKGQLAFAEPVIVVLPFQNLTGDPSRAAFVDGITEDIITRLSKFSSIRVIARTSSFAMKDSPLDVTEIGKMLGANYVLEGSIQALGADMRITAQLINAVTGTHIWAEAYDAAGADIFPVRDTITQAIASTIMSSDKGRIELEERRAATSMETSEIGAYDLLMQGWNHWYKETKEDNEEAKRLFQAAAAADPNYARAFSALAWAYANDYDNEWTDDYEATLDTAFGYAEKSIELDQTDYKSHWALGWCYLYKWEHDKALEQYEIALKLNPNDAEMLAEMGNLLIYIGEPKRAIEQILLATRLNPFHDEWYTEYLGWAYEEAGQPEDAIRVLETIQEPEEWVRRTLAASYAAVGQKDKADEEVRLILKDNPDFSLAEHEKFVRENYPYKTETQITRWIEALRRAGIPE